MMRSAPTIDSARHEAAAKLLPKPRLIIGGADLTEGSEGIFNHINPATGRQQAAVPLGGAQEVERAIASAQSAFRSSWGPMRPRDRRRLLGKFSELLFEHREEFELIQTLEMGLTATNSVNHTNIALDWTAYYSGWADKLEGLVVSAYSPDEEFGYTIPEPYGVIGHIITWNAPFMSLGMKVAPSLAAGNCVVIKPAEFTPFTSLLFADLAREAGIPEGVINVVPGTGAAGEALVSHPRVGKISFTGGPQTATRIMTTAAQTLKPVLFELGGKSANLLFADSDLDKAIGYSSLFAMSGCGQGCALPTRLLVEDIIYDEVIEKVLAHVEEIKVGDPLDTDTYHGPLVNEAAQERVANMIERAVEQGAGALRTGGSKIAGPGFFVEPTVFTDVDIDSELAQKEVFGPVLAVSKFSSEEEAVRFANATEYGLSAYIQSRDVDRVKRLVPQLNAGTVFVNKGPTPVSQPGRPFGGIGLSGFGREGGKAGIDEFIMTKGVGIGAGS
ncbi:aldehyde dehydrogenase family protein [Prescottella equi]|uniref:aldehyde dehydrogenase family protein n=1 Tax=Rhodococcus hoagii TaxID=43767 RepID=UPI00301D1C32